MVESKAILDSSESQVVYREIAGFTGYRVGSDGSVWSCWSTRRLTDIWKRMKLRPNHKGYPSVNLSLGGRGNYRTRRVHRLVLVAFVGPCPDGMECRHLNGIKADCRLDNLEWGTQEDNRGDNRRLDAYQRGGEHSQAKLTEDDVRQIRQHYAAGGILQRELAADFGITLSMVSMIVNRRSWQHVI